MLLPIKAICSKSKIRKDGTSLIFLQYCFGDNQRTLLNTEIAIPPKYWSRRHRRINDDLPEAYGIPQVLNDKIIELLRKAEDIINYGVKNDVKNLLDFVKETFSPEFDISNLEKINPTTDLRIIDKFPDHVNSVAAIIPPEVVTDNTISDVTEPDVFVQFDDYMKSKKNKVTPGMMKVYNNTKGLLMAFEIFRGQKITFDCFDYNFYDAFIDFLTNDYVQRRRKVTIKGLKQNSIGKTIKHLRVFLRDRARRKIIAPVDLTDFKILSEDADAIYLTPSEIERIYRTELPADSSLEYYRDLLVFGCLTGLRFSDFSSIQPEDIKGDMLYKKQQKSDGWVVIPLRPIAFDILVNKFKGSIPQTSNPEFNRHIKTVGRFAGVTEMVKFSYKKGNRDIVEKKPKSEWITSHTCRRSFCTNEFLAGTPVELIMKISGHKSLRDFYRYIRITPEEAGNKIKELWAQREALLSA